MYLPIKCSPKSVAAMVNNVGFTHTSQSSLSMLSGLTKAFMDGLARCCIEHTELGNRSLPNIGDALLASEQMGVDLPDLWDYMFSVASFPIKEIPSFPVATSSQDDYIIHPDMSPPRLEELLEDNLLRQKEKEKLGIMEASEFFDPTTVDREQKAKSGFPAFFGRNAQSLGIKVERVGVGPMETMDISLDSLASPIMAIRRPIAKIRKSKLKRKEEKRKKSNIAPITVPPTTMIPPPLIEPSRRVLEIRSEATKLKNYTTSNTKRNEAGRHC